MSYVIQFTVGMLEPVNDEWVTARNHGVLGHLDEARRHLWREVRDTMQAHKSFNATPAPQLTREILQALCLSAVPGAVVTVHGIEHRLVELNTP
jgi:hypothetical protein